VYSHHNHPTPTNKHINKYTNGTNLISCHSEKISSDGSETHMKTSYDNSPTFYLTHFQKLLNSWVSLRGSPSTEEHYLQCTETLLIPPGHISKMLSKLRSKKFHSDSKANRIIS